MIKTYALTSPSHEALVHVMKASLPEDLCLHLHHTDQRCPSGNFGQAGWLETMGEKMRILLRACQSVPHGEVVLHSDVDVQFFTAVLSPFIHQSLEHVDFCGQNNIQRKGGKVMCGGFFAFRVTPQCQRLFEDILALMGSEGVNDQVALNRLLPQSGLRYGFFSDTEVWCPRRQWKPGQNLEIPPDMLVHHANWTIGSHSKLKQLALVRGIVAQRNSIKDDCQ